MSELTEILRDIAMVYNIPENELISKYITPKEDIAAMPVAKLKEMIQKMGGDTKGKRKKGEWVEMTKQLLKEASKSHVDTEIVCEVRKFGDLRCALHAESGRIYSIETHGEIGRWSEKEGPVFFNLDAGANADVH